jgi:hypothetical protein
VGVTVSTDDGPVAKLTVGGELISGLGISSVTVEPYDPNLEYTQFVLHVENSPTSYNNYMLNIAPDDGSTLDNTLGTTSSGIVVYYWDSGDGVYDYKWASDGLSVTFNDPISQSLLTIKEMETIINNIIAVAR